LEIQYAAASLRNLLLQALEFLTHCRLEIGCGQSLAVEADDWYWSSGPRW
jgi:hypothetical protein